MFADPITQWVFTIAFGLLAVYYLLRAFSDFGMPVLVIGHLLHIVMCVDMAAMAWPWWTQVPWLAQVIFFAAATFWYLALIAVTARNPRRAEGWGGGPAHQFMHVLMMGAMTWMVLAMKPGEAPSNGAHDHHLMSAEVAVAGIILTAGLLATGAETAIRARQAFRLKGRLVTESSASTVMNFGMAAMCALMLAM